MAHAGNYAPCKKNFNQRVATMAGIARNVKKARKTFDLRLQ
jgi:hypothetical protein